MSVLRYQLLRLVLAPHTMRPGFLLVKPASGPADRDGTSTGAQDNEHNNRDASWQVSTVGHESPPDARGTEHRLVSDLPAHLWCPEQLRPPARWVCDATYHTYSALAAHQTIDPDNQMDLLWVIHRAQHPASESNYPSTPCRAPWCLRCREFQGGYAFRWLVPSAAFCQAYDRMRARLAPLALSSADALRVAFPELPPLGSRGLPV